MKKILLIAIIAVFGLVGCVDKVKVSCPDCTITNEGNYNCTGCSVEAERYESVQLLQRPEKP